MKWIVQVTNVMTAERRREEGLTTSQVYWFVAKTKDITPQIANHVFLTLVTTSEANFGPYKFAADYDG